LRIAEGLVVDELGIAVVLIRLADGLGKAAGGHTVLDDRALWVDQTQRAVGDLEGLILVDQAEVVGREVGEDLNLLFKGAGDLLVGGERQTEVGIGLGDHGEDLVALGGCERLGDAAGDDPSWMDAFVAE